MRFVPLAYEGLKFLLGFQGVLTCMATLNSLLARLTLVAVLCVQYVVAHALLFFIKIFVQRPALLALQALAVRVEICDLCIALEALWLITFHLAFNTIDETVAALFALGLTARLVKVEAVAAFDACRGVAYATIGRGRVV